MTITEAAACGTPSVVTDIGGHADAVVEGHTGFLAPSMDSLVASLDRVLGDRALRDRLSANSIERTGRLTWAATARGTLEILAAEASRRSAKRS